MSLRSLETDTRARGGPCSLRGILLGAPIVFIAHFLEEAPGFVAWFNAHVSRGITDDLFRSVNLTALGITIAVVASEWLSKSAISAGLAIAWLSFLMGANAALHIVGAIVDGSYVPGLYTAVLLYLPYYAWLISTTLLTRRLSASVLVPIAILAASPMVAHGYLILFRGSRLF